MKKIKVEAVVVVSQNAARCANLSGSQQPVTLAQVARAWGMSQRTLRRRVKSGLIQAVKASSTQRHPALGIEAATVNAFLAARWCPKNADEVKAEVEAQAQANAEEVW